MKYTRKAFLTRHDNVGEGTFDSIAWAMETHVKESDNPVYNAAMLYGNEDAPQIIDFYCQVEPLLTDKPVRRWTEQTQ